MGDGIMANRRDILRAATGLAAVAVVGNALLDTDQASAEELKDVQTEAVMQIEGIGEFGVLAWSWGASSGGGIEQATAQDLSVTKYVDVFSTALQLAVITGKHIPRAVLTVTNRLDDEVIAYLILILEDVYISSFRIGGDDVIPMDSITLNFAKISHEYKPQKPDGTLDSPTKYQWNIATGEVL